MKTEINKKEIDISSKDRWSMKGVDSKNIKELNPELFKKLQKGVEHYLENRFNSGSPESYMDGESLAIYKELKNG